MDLPRVGLVPPNRYVGQGWQLCFLGNSCDVLNIPCSAQFHVFVSTRHTETGQMNVYSLKNPGRKPANQSDRRRSFFFPLKNAGVSSTELLFCWGTHVAFMARGSKKQAARDIAKKSQATNNPPNGVPVGEEKREHLPTRPLKAYLQSILRASLPDQPNVSAVK